MNLGKTLFAQLMEFVPWSSFARIVARYSGDARVSALPSTEHFRIMAYAQLTWRESLRDIETTLGANPTKLYAMGLRQAVRRSTLADANERRDWRIWADFAAVLIRRANKLCADEPLGLDVNIAGNVYALDSSTIDLCLSLFDWAPFRSIKAVIKLHTLLNLRGSSPASFISATARWAMSMCSIFCPSKLGAFYIMDRGYLDFARLYLMHQAGAFFVIIFQSGTAYKALRKMLVDTSLVAVVSLPAGVFNPYSGVKTSILILDKCLHKQLDRVLFVKVGNDGFNLGAQRRAVVNSDLPEATRLMRSRMTAPQGFEGDGAMARAVTRSKIGANGDFNLSGERYITTAFAHTHYEVVRVADVCDVNPRKAELNELPETTRVSFVPMKDLVENTSDFVPQEERSLGEVRQGAYTYFRDGDVLVAKVTPCFENGKAGVARKLLNGIGFGSSEYYVLRPSERLLPELLYHFITSPHFRAIVTPAMTGTGGLQRVPKGIVEEFQIPLPPLEVQHQIVAEIEGYKKAIDEHRKAIDQLEEQAKAVIDKVWGGCEK